MAANFNRPCSVPLPPATQSGFAPDAGGDASAQNTVHEASLPVKSRPSTASVMQPPGAFRDFDECDAAASGSYDHRHIVGSNPHIVVLDDCAYWPDDPLESHRTGRALLHALRSDPAAPNAATPLQARALTAAVALIFLAFLVGWAFLGLPAPDLAHID